MPRAVKAGFSGPLKIDVELDLKSLRGLLAKHAPIGKTRPPGFTVKGKRYTYRNKPPAPGMLRKSFYKAGAVKLNRKKTGVVINSDLPYARAVDKGHRAYTVRPKVAKFLMFRGSGRKRFFKQARIPRSSGTGFVKKAVDEWRSRRGIKSSIKVRWAPYKKGAA